MADKKMILKIKIDESGVLKQLGMANQFKSIVVTQGTSCADLKSNLLKVMCKGLTDEQRITLQADVAEFQIAEKVDGKVVRRYEINEFPFKGKDVVPTSFIFAKPKKDKNKGLSSLKNKSGGTVKSRDKSSKRKSVFSQKPMFDKMSDSRSSSSPLSSFPSLSSSSSGGGFSMEREKSSKNLRQSMSTMSLAPPPQHAPPTITAASLQEVAIRPDQEILMEIVRKCFKGMGIPDNKIEILEYQTKEVASLHEFFDPPLIKKTLEDIENHLEPDYKELADLRIRAFIDRCLRGYICRKRYARFKRDFLPLVPGGPSPPLGVRLHYIKEMIKNETAFRDRLYFTFNKVERQLKEVADGDGWLSKSDWKQLFSDSATFRTFFGRQLKKFEKVYNYEWPDLDWGEICTSLVKDFEDNGAIFHALAMKHQEIVEVIEAMVARPEFQTFFGQVSSDRKAYQYLQGNNFGIDALIFDPLSRVAHYESTLKRLLGLTSKARKEYWLLEESLDKLTRMLAKFEEEKLQSKDNVRLNKVARKFGSVAGLDRSIFGFLPGDERGFVFDTELTCLNYEKEKWKGHDCTLMVFTDVVLISSENKGNLVSEEGGCMLMCQVSVEQRFDVQDPKYPSDLVFKLISEPKKDTKVEFILACKTNSEKNTLVNRLVPLVKQNRLCFGRSIKEVVDENKTELPVIVTTALSTLRAKNAQQLEGIFRIAGEYSYLTQMKSLFDRWKADDDPVQLDKYDSFDIASLLKQWFRELPEPVLTYPIYDKYVATDDDVNFEEFLADLPPLNRRVVLAVMGFNVELTKFSDSNKMTPANIAICWGPTILRPLKEDMTSSMRIPRVNQIVENLVKWCAQNPDRIPTVQAPRKFTPKPAPGPRMSMIRAGSRDGAEEHHHPPSFASCRPQSGTSTMIRMGSGGARRGGGLRTLSMAHGISPRGSPPPSPSSPAPRHPPPSAASPRPTASASPRPTPSASPRPTAAPPTPSSPAPTHPPPSAASSSPSRPPPSAVPTAASPSRPPPPAAAPVPAPSQSAGRRPLPPPVAALPPPVPGAFVAPPPRSSVILPPSPSCPASLSQQSQQ